ARPSLHSHGSAQGSPALASPMTYPLHAALSNVFGPSSYAAAIAAAMHRFPASPSSRTRFFAALDASRAMQRAARERSIARPNPAKGLFAFRATSALLSATLHRGSRMKSAGATAPSQKTAGVISVPAGGGHPGHPGSAISGDASASSANGSPSSAVAASS